MSEREAQAARSDTARLDEELARQLDVIRAEEVPERLLDLARELQSLLRARDEPH